MTQAILWDMKDAWQKDKTEDSQSLIGSYNNKNISAKMYMWSAAISIFHPYYRSWGNILCEES